MVNNIYKQLQIKAKRSYGIFVILNLIAFICAALLIVLNLYAIKLNPANPTKPNGDRTIMLMFVLMSIMSAAGGLVSSFMGFFVFRKKADKSKEQADSISFEKQRWKKGEDEYSDKKIKMLFLLIK